MNAITRRHFFGRAATGVGTAALLSLVRATRRPTADFPACRTSQPRAKRVIYLFQSGGPSQMELYDYKPRLKEFQGTDLPESIRARAAAHQHVVGASSAFRSCRRSSPSHSTANPARG